MTEPKKTVAVNDRGRRIGESHPRAKMTDHEVDLVRELVEQLIDAGVPRKLVYEEVAAKFEVHARTVKKYHYCERRAHTAARMKRVG